MLFLCVLLFATLSLAASLNDYDVGNRTKRGRWLKFKINLFLQQQNSLSMQVLPSTTPHRSARYGTTVGSGQLIRLFWLAPFKRRRYVREGREIWFMYKIRAYQAEQARMRGFTLSDSTFTSTRVEEWDQFFWNRRMINGPPGNVNHLKGQLGVILLAFLS